MPRNIEDMLKNTDLPDFESGDHRQMLRRQVLDEMGRRSQMIAHKKRITNIAIIVLVSLSTLAAATIVLQKISFVKKEEGSYIFRGPTQTVSTTRHEDGTLSSTSIATQYRIRPDKNGTIDVEQKRKDLEEVEYLRQQNKRSIRSIIDIEYQNKSRRTFRYMYKLSNGRVMTLNEGRIGQPSLKDLQPKDFAEAHKRFRAKEGTLLPPKEEVVKGKTFVFERRKITLSNGKEVIRSVGTPDKSNAGTTPAPHQTKTPQTNVATETKFTKEDRQEIQALRLQDKREIVDVTEIANEHEVLLRVYSFRYTLADGRKQDIGEGRAGEPVGEKMTLEDLKEIHNLRFMGKGVKLAPEVKVIKDKTFVLEREQITLSDGQVFFYSLGKPKDQTTKAVIPDLKRKGYALYSNVPNPFNPQTTLRYELPEVSDIRIVVYNLTGQEVRTLIDREMSAGSHRIVWDGKDTQGRNVASGTYLIRMQGPQFIQTQKVSLVR